MADRTGQFGEQTRAAAPIRRLNLIWFSLPIRYKGATVIAFPLVCFFVSLIWYARLQQNIADTEALVRHTERVRLEASGLRNALVDGETGVRGYDITHRREFLEPYIAAQGTIPDSLATLRELVKDNPAQSQRVSELETLTRQRLDNLRINLDRLAHGATGVELTAALEQGKATMDLIRRKLDAFVAEEQRLLDERTARLERQRRLTLDMLGIAAILGTAGGVVAVYLFSFGITRRLTALIDNARRLAHGAPLLTAGPGDDEITALDRELHAAALVLAEREDQLRRNNRELEEQNRRVQEATRLKSQFLANMSHELRTPLNGIIGFAELLHDGAVGQVSDEQREYLGDILTSSRHLLQLINDILDLAKVEAGKMEFRPEPVDLARLIDEARDILRTLADRKRIDIEVVIDPALGEVVIDPSRLKQVLYNYLSNALKFTPDEGRVVVRAAHEGADAFRVEVEDTGIGIRLEDVGRLFGEFEQLDASASKRYQGTGLGLALTKRIVEAQGGTVGVRSTPGQGSSFFAILPRVAETARPGLAAVTGAPHATPQRAPVILVIEDDPQDQDWLAQTLAGAGYAVQIAATGAEALAKCRERAFDAITLDLLLPDAGGWDVLRAIRTTHLNRDVPAIVVTVVAEKEAGIGFSIHDFLVKPAQPEELIASLERAGVGPDGTSTVLVVDDDPNALKIMETTLSRLGVRPICRADAESGLRAAAEEQPDVVVLDLLMPRMDGFEFLERFRHVMNDRRTPVIVWTNKDLTAGDRARLQAAAEAVVLKSHGGSIALLDELRAYLPEGRAREREAGGS